MNLKDEVTRKIGAETARENPFVASDEFVELIKGVALITKALLMGSSGPAEFMNALLSVVVTMLKNIPDRIWDSLRERVHDADKPTEVTAIMFNHMDAMRSYHKQGSKYIIIEGDEDSPQITVKPPTTPC